MVLLASLSQKMTKVFWGKLQFFRWLLQKAPTNQIKGTRVILEGNLFLEYLESGKKFDLSIL